MSVMSDRGLNALINSRLDERVARSIGSDVHGEAAEKA